MKNKSALTLIFLTVFIDLLGFGILIPVLPTFATKELHMGETSIGIAIALYSLVQFFFNSVLGRLSDKYGRKPLITICLLLNALGYIIFAFTNTFFVLLVSRVVGGIGGSSVGVAQAFIADETTKEDRSKGMGLIGAAFGLGFVFGPLIGGILAKYGYNITGFASAAFSLSAFVLTIFFLPESLKIKQTHIKLNLKLIDVSAVKKIFKKNDLATTISLSFLLTFSVANIYGTFALLGYKVYHFTDLQNGYLFGILGFSSAIVQGGLIHMVTKYLNKKNMIITGSFLMALGLGFISYGGTFLGISLIIVVLAFGNGILQPTLLSLVSEFTSEAEQGSTLGINQSFSSLARVFGPLWGGFAFQFLGYSSPFLTGAACTFAIFIVSVKYMPRYLTLEKKNVREFERSTE